MKSLQTRYIFLFAALFIFYGCSDKDPDPAPESEKPFVITDHFLALTYTPKSGASKYTVVSFIEFLEDGKALHISSSTTNVVGNYTLTEDSLIFEVTGGNARTARFALDKDKKITSAYYKASGPLEYETTGELFSLDEANQLVGKTFKGDEYGMSGTVNRSELIYTFNQGDMTAYGSGTDDSTIDDTANSCTLFGGNGFKSTNNDGVELGFVSGKKLTVYRLDGLYYSGTYDQQ